MKRKNLLVLMLLLTAGGISTEVVAQQHLEALVKKYEDLDPITKNVVSKKNPETNKMEDVFTSLTIKYSDDFFKEVAAAFKKDKENAVEAIESINKKNTSLFYKFEHVSYSFSGSGTTIHINVSKKTKKKIVE